MFVGLLVRSMLFQTQKAQKYERYDRMCERGGSKDGTCVLRLLCICCAIGVLCGMQYNCAGSTGIRRPACFLVPVALCMYWISKGQGRVDAAQLLPCCEQQQRVLQVAAASSACMMFLQGYTWPDRRLGVVVEVCCG